MIQKISHILLAIAFGYIHVLFADILFFYGTVIDPQWSHQMLNTIAFVLLLPFSALLLIPGIQDFFVIAQISIMGFWIVFYYRLVSIICPQKWTCCFSYKDPV